MKIRHLPLAAFVLAASALPSRAQVAVTYLDADTTNTVAYDDATYPGTDWLGGHSGDDDLWAERAFGNGGGVFTTNDINKTGKEDAPGLVTTITGLTPGKEYTVFAYFWSATNANWRLKASLTETPPLASAKDTLFGRSGTGTTTNAPAVPEGADGTDNLGVTYTDDGTGTWTSTSYFSTGVMVGEGNRRFYQATLGTATADANGEIKVYIDDLENTNSANRTWYDGVGYMATDSDNDGMDDAWEIENGLVVGIDDSALDPDSDSLTNIQEFQAGTNPQKADTDDDQLNDGVEVAGPTDPLNPDSDGDLYHDGVEVARGTDPMDPDSIAYPTTGFCVDFTNAGNLGGPYLDQDCFPFVADHETDVLTDPDLGVNRSVTWPVAAFGGADVTVDISYPDADDPRIMQMYDRGTAALANYEGTRPSLVRDWVGTDSRTTSGGNGPDTPTTLRMEISGLPDGTYLFRSYHHDLEAQQGRFQIEVTDATRTAENLGYFRLTHSTDRPEASVSDHRPQNPGTGNPPSVLPSTIEFVFTVADGKPVDVDFKIQQTAGNKNDFVRYSFFVCNGIEISPTTDSDGDFVPDGDDLHPGQDDATLDDDSDNLNNLREYHLGTDPTKADSDEDGWNDDVETDTDVFVDLSDTGTSPFVADWDADGLKDGLETNDLDFSAWPTAAGTNPYLVDTDGDGYADGEEAFGGFDPTDPDNNPGNVPRKFSARIVAMDFAGGSVTLEWDSVPGATYDVYASSTMEGDPENDWELVDQFIASGGDTTTYTDTNLPDPAPAKRFYKIYEFAP